MDSRIQGTFGFEHGGYIHPYIAMLRGDIWENDDKPWDFNVPYGQNDLLFAGCLCFVVSNVFFCHTRQCIHWDDESFNENEQSVWDGNY